ncbi:MAG TPA: GSU2403 family nucleotidyltransferase fold protein [Candidatus Deferrimicrobium sp.]|nr:GSU2403 family nucleotidyltransferase fold protein [Candidatus Deferrimicrobium sp.]
MTEIKELEQLFFKVIDDLEDYLPHLVLVGGWTPYLYVKYLWKNISFYPVTTTDIDFGFSEKNDLLSIKEPIYARFSKLHYSERHFQMNRLFPIVPLLENTRKSSKLLIEFITTPTVSERYIETLVGRQILVNRLDKFDILLRDSIQIELIDREVSPYRVYFVKVPPPHIFLFHKALTFTDRENEAKMGKDIYYIYYILRFHPHKESLFNDLTTLNLPGERKQITGNLQQLFSRVTSLGCIMVEKENGPDDFIRDIRKDAFQRLRELIQVLNQ